MKFRRELKSSDVADIRDILNSSGFFYDHEVAVALELVEENLSKGEEASGYVFLIAEDEDKLLGFACYGKNPCTEDSFDFYWMAVRQDQRGSGIGREMIKRVEEDIVRLSGKNIWIETSSRPLYEPTRRFYIKTGYTLVAELPNFYAKNDHKSIYLKTV